MQPAKRRKRKSGLRRTLRRTYGRIYRCIRRIFRYIKKRKYFILNCIFLECFILVLLLGNVQMGNFDLKKMIYIKQHKIISTAKVDESVIIDQMGALYKLNDFYMESDIQPIESYCLEGYSLEKNKLPFYNIGTYDSQGLCNAFSLVEKYNYLGKIDEIILNEEYLEQEGIDLELIPQGDLSEYKLSDEQYIRLRGGNVLDPSHQMPYSSQEIYRYHTDYYDEHTQNLTEILEDQKIGNLINLLNYIQDTLGTDNSMIQKYRLQPCYYYDEDSRRYEIMRNDPTTEVGDLDVEGMLENLKEDIPVMLGVWNGSSGHSLLAYKYEKMTEDIIKVYVSDSNISLLEERGWMNEDEKAHLDQYNQDVHEQVFVLFKWNQGIKKWEYVYNPRVNGNYVYDGGYNFYIPNDCIEIEVI